MKRNKIVEQIQKHSNGQIVPVSAPPRSLITLNSVPTDRNISEILVVPDIRSGSRGRFHLTVKTAQGGSIAAELSPTLAKSAMYQLGHALDRLKRFTKNHQFILVGPDESQATGYVSDSEPGPLNVSIDITSIGKTPKVQVLIDCGNICALLMLSMRRAEAFAFSLEEGLREHQLREQIDLTE
ncbi:hypothetical protein SBV1_2680002 [Verrucomicrobia bacterium]|nr:hypothetical protein SBV1_2680002 [Verrucomicrobiota bacterium]